MLRCRFSPGPFLGYKDAFFMMIRTLSARALAVAWIQSVKSQSLQSLQGVKTISHLTFFNRQKLQACEYLVFRTGLMEDGDDVEAISSWAR